MDLSAKYLGMQLRTPLVASASPKDAEIDALLDDDPLKDQLSRIKKTTEARIEKELAA